MQTKVIETYGIEELTGKAREVAFDWLREGLDYEWWDFVFEDAKKCASILGIRIDNIYFSGFCSQGDGACFNGAFAYAKGWKKTLLDYAPIDAELLRIGKELQAIQKSFFYSLSGAIECNDRYKTTKAVCHWSDYNMPEEDLSQVFSDFASWIYKQLQTVYEWLMSEEQLIETAKSNGYMFDSEGRII